MAEEDGQIKGLLGFIPYDDHSRDVTLAIWKTLKTSDTMLGIHILEFLRKNGDIKSISAPGINARTVSIYQFLGMRTGCMNQARLEISPILGLENDSGFDLAQCLKRAGQTYKSLDFIDRRYFSHPVFDYIKYGVKLGEQKLFVVLRVQPWGCSKALRLIDCIGDHQLIQFLTPMLDKLLDDLDCEYIDCYETGIDANIFRNGGRQYHSGILFPV